MTAAIERTPEMTSERTTGVGADPLTDRLTKVAYATEFLDVREDIFALIERDRKRWLDNIAVCELLAKAREQLAAHNAPSDAARPQSGEPDVPAEVGELVERLRGIATTDHERGCEGRCYSCTCGWDAANDKLGPEAATALEALSRKVEGLRGALESVEGTLLWLWLNTLRGAPANRCVSAMNIARQALATHAADTKGEDAR